MLRDVALLVVVAAFRTEAQSPILTPLRPISIVEPEKSPLARPRAIAVDRDGGFYIADAGSAMVSRFTSDGKFVQSYGRAGDGPGELRVPTRAAVIDDSILAVADTRRRELSFFRRSSGAFLSRVRLPGQPGSIHGGGENVWVGALDVAARRGAARINPRTGAVEPGVSIPSIFEEGSPVSVLEYEVHVVPDAARIIAGFSATNYLVSLAPNRVADTIWIPILKRRGVPSDLRQQIVRIKDARDFYELMSSTLAVERLGSGTILVAHVDATWRPGASFPTTPGGADPFTYKLFVSLIRLSDRRVCADIPVPISGSARPGLAVRGDSLLVLDQDESNDVHPWQIRRYTVDEKACSW